jgi:hypothetical protein
LAAGGGAITLALVTALPSAGCAALAQTYGIAISHFGAAAFSGIAASIFSLEDSPAEIRRFHQYVQRIFIAFGGFAFWVGVNAAAYNLHIAVNHCLVGTDEQVAAGLHKQIDLWSPFWPY